MTGIPHLCQCTPCSLRSPRLTKVRSTNPSLRGYRTTSKFKNALNRFLNCAFLDQVPGELTRERSQLPLVALHELWRYWDQQGDIVLCFKFYKSVQYLSFKIKLPVSNQTPVLHSTCLRVNIKFLQKSIRLCC